MGYRGYGGYYGRGYGGYGRGYGRYYGKRAEDGEGQANNEKEENKRAPGLMEKRSQVGIVNVNGDDSDEVTKTVLNAVVNNQKPETEITERPSQGLRAY